MQFIIVPLSYIPSVVFFSKLKSTKHFTLSLERKCSSPLINVTALFYTFSNSCFLLLWKLSIYSHALGCVHQPWKPCQLIPWLLQLFKSLWWVHCQKCFVCPNMPNKIHSIHMLVDTPQKTVNYLWGTTFLCSSHAVKACSSLCLITLALIMLSISLPRIDNWPVLSSPCPLAGALKKKKYRTGYFLVLW